MNKEKLKFLELAKALDLMRRGSCLLLMHTRNGLAWFVVPGGRVTDLTAAKIRERAVSDRTTFATAPIDGASHRRKARRHHGTPPHPRSTDTAITKRPGAGTRTPNGTLFPRRFVLGLSQKRKLTSIKTQLTIAANSGRGLSKSPERR